MKIKAETKSERMRQYAEKQQRKKPPKSHGSKLPKQGITLVVAPVGTGYGKAFKSKWTKEEKKED